ncbi:bacteriocin [Rheinheimera pleomorphica]
MKTLSSSELNNISGGNPLFWGGGWGLCLRCYGWIRRH